MVSTGKILKTYGLSEEMGFLPMVERVEKLPSDFDAWEEVAHQFTDSINSFSLRKKLDGMEIIHNPTYSNAAERERGMLLLSFFAHAYVFAWEGAVSEIPESIAIPWVETARQLGRPPILSHASAVLNNWYLIDGNKGFEKDNLSTVIQFQGTKDEAWFFLQTARIEQKGGKAVKAAVDAILSVEQRDDFGLESALETMHSTLKTLIHDLNEMYLHCDPYVFYNRVRPFLSSFENIRYRGIENPNRSYHGGSAAQSSLIQMFDAVLGLKNHNSFLMEMRNYMPPRHVEFLNFLQFKSKIRPYSEERNSLNGIYRECIDTLRAFRTAHLKIVQDYIVKQKGTAGPGQKGTGGTEPTSFLARLRDETQ